MLRRSRKKVLVDTCIWIEYFKGHSKESDSLRKLIEENLVAGCGMVLCELLQGAKGEKEKRAISEIFDAIEFIETTKNLWAEAGQISEKLRSGGKTIPLSDILVACCSKKMGYSIFTLDIHFEEIPGIHLFKF